MYFNNAQCDVFIGTGAGKKLVEEIAEAQVSVKIVSPFLSARLLDGLLVLYEKGVQVELVTAQGDQGNLDLLKNLIRRDIHVDRRAKGQLAWLKWILWVCYGSAGLGLTAAWSFFVLRETRPMLLALMVFGIFGLGAWLLRYAMKNQKLYSYSYRPIFPLKIVRRSDAFGKGAAYIHSKLYIIDDRIAYLGSLNFTYNGTESNYETRVRLSDGASVQKIVGEFRSLMNSRRCPELDFQEWGERVFTGT